MSDGFMQGRDDMGLRRGAFDVLEKVPASQFVIRFGFSLAVIIVCVIVNNLREFCDGLRRFRGSCGGAAGQVAPITPLRLRGGVVPTPKVLEISSRRGNDMIEELVSSISFLLLSCRASYAWLTRPSHALRPRAPGSHYGGSICLSL